MKLERAEVHRVQWPLADGGRGGAAQGRWSARAGAIILLHGEDKRGLGEASPLPRYDADDGAMARAAAQLEGFARALPITIDPSQPRQIAAILAGSLDEPAARFALETAVLDLLGRRADRSIAALLSDTASRSVAASTVIDDRASALAARRAGFRTLKLKAADDLDGVRTVRHAVPEARLRLDVNQGWPEDDVDRRLAVLAGLGLEYVEEPSLDLAPRLDAKRACRIALDESLARPDRETWLDRALASGAVAALVLKPTVLGGLDACLHLAARARAHGVDAVASHALEGPIATAAVAELARALGGSRAHGVDDHAGLHTWPRVPPQLVGPLIVVAPTPGLGIELHDRDRLGGAR